MRGMWCSATEGTKAKMKYLRADSTADGDERRVPAGGFVLFADVDGKSLHSSQEQTVLWISLP